MKIGAVAAAAKVNEQTLRYYERVGLLTPPARQPNGYREYPPSAVDVVRFIKRAQELGFSLDDARQLLALRQAPEAGCSRAQALVQTKLETVDRKLVDLIELRGALAQLLEHCGDVNSDGCAIIEALDGRAVLSPGAAVTEPGGCATTRSCAPAVTDRASTRRDLA
jgi:MerR family mercuric resistance operon transcriptional regulator